MLFGCRYEAAYSRRHADQLKALPHPFCHRFSVAAEDTERSLRL
jgi:hypothetical protein